MASDEGVRRKGDGWQAYYDHGGRQHTAMFATKTAAKAWRTEQKAQLQRGDWIAPADGSIWVKDFLDQWLGFRKPRIAEGSYTRYESIVRNHLKPAFGHMRLNQLTTSRIQQWVDSLEPCTAHTQFPILRMAMNWAASGKGGTKRLAKAPTDDVEQVTYKAREMTFLEPDELRDLLEHEPEEWARDLILGLAFTGARIGELAAVTPREINPMRGTISLYATKTKTRRTLPIAGPLLEVVERRLALGNETVWGMKNGGPISPANFRRRTWYPLLERAGIGRHIRVHDLRHTTASWLIGSGKNPVEVCKWMGHSKPTQTLDTYAHLFGTDMQDMASALESMWDAPPTTNVLRMGVAK